MSRLLINEPPLMVLPQLAALIGLNEAIVLQQVHYWTRDGRNVIDGRSWTYNTIAGWHEQFPFWSVATIRRTFDALLERGLLVKRKLSENKFDATLWYSIDVEASNALDAQIDSLNLSTSVCDDLPFAQIEQMSCAQNEQISSAQNEQITRQRLPKTKPETSDRAINTKSAKEFVLPDWIKADLWADFEELRRKKKKPLTDRARQTAVNKLAKLREAGQNIEACIEQTVLHAWDTFYPVAANGDGNRKGEPFGRAGIPVGEYCNPGDARYVN